MHCAARALGISHLGELDVGYPILDINSASEGCNHSVVGRTVPDEPLYVASGVQECFDLR